MTYTNNSNCPKIVTTTCTSNQFKVEMKYGNIHVLALNVLAL